MKLAASTALRVLVVEDESSVAGAIATVLRRRGHAVRLAQSAEEALCLPRAALHCDVIVSDLCLPGRDGLELIEELRARGVNARSLLLSGSPRLEQVRRALQLGVGDLLSKPFALSDLVAAVELRPKELASEFSLLYTIGEDAAEGALRKLGAFALEHGLGPTLRTRLLSAVGELLDNAKRHATGCNSMAIFVHAALRGDQLVVEVEDQGRGFDVRTWQERGGPQAGGGIARASTLCEELVLESSSSGTRLKLSFHCGPSHFEEDQGTTLSERDWLDPHTARQLLHELHCGTAPELSNLSPAMAVTVGRLLAGTATVEQASSFPWSTR